MANIQIIHTLREALKSEHCDGMVLPVTDEYQGEYSAAYARRVEWLSGFDGSAGMLVILLDKAALLTDGRYTLQAARQLDGAVFEVVDSGKMSTAEYLKAQVSAGSVIGYDPWLHSARQIAMLEKALTGHATLRPLAKNPIDALWYDQPSRPCHPIFRHEDALAGRISVEKMADLIAQMHKDANALLLTEPDAICWLLNIRGGDVPFNPLPLCYAVLTRAGDVALIIDPAKVPDGVLDAHVKVVDERSIIHNGYAMPSPHPLPEGEGIKTTLATQETLCKPSPSGRGWGEGNNTYLATLVGKSLQYDPATCPIWFVQQLQAAVVTLHEADNPVTLLRSVKNATEQDNIRRAHAVDGAAMQKFLTWLTALPEEQSITELDIIKKLESFRREHPDYRGASFATIAGAGEHGAIVHYRATLETNRSWAVGEALLVDSGGQYPYGTTDVTRTVFRGTPSAAFKRHFTLVLKGHIALARAVFPEGTTGHQLDVLARQFLWQEGLDYAHGTGHGVGHYLCVHEGPQSISTRANGVPLKAGMILSNEPGFYAQGAYGIRIESLVLVVEKHTTAEGTRFLGFETLTRVPIDPRLTEPSLLNDDERTWLDRYNAWARE